MRVPRETNKLGAMSSTAQPFVPERTAAMLALVAISGAAAAGLDLAFAIVFYGLQGVGTSDLLRGIAGAALGARAREIGTAADALGVLFHFLISVTAAMIYYAASRRFPLLTRRPLFSGAVFGVLMYFTMRLVVLPLSHVGFHVPRLGDIVGELCSHIFLFGWVIAFGVAWAQRSR